MFINFSDLNLFYQVQVVLDNKHVINARVNMTIDQLNDQPQLLCYAIIIFSVKPFQLFKSQTKQKYVHSLN